MQNDFLSTMTGNSRCCSASRDDKNINFVVFLPVTAYEQAILLLDRLIRLKSFFPFPSSLHILSASSFSVGIIIRKNSQRSLSSLVFHHF